MLSAQVRRRLPQVFVTRSTELTREWYEYERCSTTAIDAYLSPLLARYLGRLEAARQAGVRQCCRKHLC